MGQEFHQGARTLAGGTTNTVPQTPTLPSQQHLSRLSGCNAKRIALGGLEKGIDITLVGGRLLHWYRCSSASPCCRCVVPLKRGHGNSLRRRRPLT